MARQVSEKAEEMLDQTISCLDHGWVVPIDYMGTDQRIVDAARISVGGDNVKSVSTNRGLIRYLLRNKHTTPFEKVRFEFAAKMPIHVARQWIRHRMSSVNEMSGRYGELPKEFYIPEDSRMQVQSKNNKQGSGDSLGIISSIECQESMKAVHEESYSVYEKLLNEYDLAREVARGVLPTNLYTKWYWTIDLWNLMNFLRLRLDSHAQYEIRVYAQAMEKFVRAVVPLAMEAFDDYIRYAETMSAGELSVLRSLHINLPSDEELKKTLGSKREVREFKKKMGKNSGRG